MASYFLLQSIVLTAVVTTVLCASQPFTSSVSVSDHYFTGDDITCTVTITNTQDKLLYLLKRNTPQDEGLYSNIFDIRDPDSNRIQYDGIFLKRMLPSENEFVLIEPGKSVTVSIDLTTAYALHKEGVYSVAMDTHIVYTESKNFTTKFYNRQHLVSQPAKFQLHKHETKTAKRPEGELHRHFETLSLIKTNLTKTERLGATGPVSPSFSGRRTSSDEAYTKSAYSLAFDRVQKASTYIDANPYLYQTWFGARYTSYVSQTKHNFDNLYNAITTKVYTFYFYGPKCKTNVFAYTYFDSLTIYLCGAYLNADLSYGHDTKYGTIVHEMSHAVVHTQDLVYGQVDGQNLALNDPYKAIYNADNYEYFVESMTS